MADSSAPLPPPAPPLPPARYGNRAKDAIVRFAQPFGIFGARPATAQVNRTEGQPSRPGKPNLLSPSPPSSQFATHKTGIPIAALDVSPQRTHAVLAGKDILKTIRISGTNCAEEFNLRSAIISYASTHSSTAGALPSRHRDQLAANDVKWSHRDYDRTIATAAPNGRIVLYDIHRPGVELARLHEHNRQVHRLAFSPFAGSKLLSGSQDGTIRLWDLRALAGERSVMTLRSDTRFQGNADAIRDVRWSPTDDVEFAIGTDQGVIQRWDTRKENAPLLKINAHEKACFSVDWHLDGRHLLSASSDQHIKVWDFKSVERRQKPLAQFKAPQAVMNARWRPPCWSSEAQSAGDWQSTQVVTGYNQEDPRVHLWDLRRPYIPFREFDRYSTAPTDLLWHSKNLLWTVGNEGMFTQTDIQFAPQVIHRRSVSVAAWRPGGDFLAFAQRRSTRRGSGIADISADFLTGGRDRGSSGEKSTPNRSLTEEGHEEGFLSTSFRRRQSKSSSARPSKSLGGTPPSRDDYRPILRLDEALHNRVLKQASQVGAYGNVSGAVASSAEFKYLARNYAWRPIEGNLDVPLPVTRASLDVYFEKNASVAESIGLYRLGQTWRICGAAAGDVYGQRLRQLECSEPTEPKPPAVDVIAYESEQQQKEENHNKKLKSHVFKGVVETEMFRGVNENDSTSNMTTPLAKPLPDSPLSTLSPTTHHQAHLYQQIEPITPLPPSILSSELASTRAHKNKAQSERVSHEDTQSRGNGPQSGSLEAQDHEHENDIPAVLADEQKSPSRTNGRNADWRASATTDYGEKHVKGSEKYEEQKRAALRDYRAQARPLLTFDKPADQQSPLPRPVPLERHDSTESFPMFSASTDSSHRAKSMGGSFPSSDLSTHAAGTPDQPGLSTDTTKTNSHAVGSVSNSNLAKFVQTEFYKHNPPIDMGMDGASDDRSDEQSATTSDHPSLTHVDDATDDFDQDEFPLDRPDPPLRLNKEPGTKPATTVARGKMDIQKKRPIKSLNPLSNNGEQQFPDPDEKDNMPVQPLHILQAVSRYMLQSNGDAQYNSRMLFDVEHLYTQTHHHVQEQMREAILKTYHSALLRNNCYIEATHLRKLCHPLYPSVYDHLNEDIIYINIWCPTCEKPFENTLPDSDRLTCERCLTTLAPCPICNCRDLPSDVVEAFKFPTTSVVDATTQDKALWTHCPGCGHGGHVGCMQLWLSSSDITADTDELSGSCPTDGCFHDCGPGMVRDERVRSQVERYLALKKRKSARKDSWVVGESRAVVKARKVLKDAEGSGTPGEAAAVSGGVSAGAGGKRVRLITPED